MCSFSRKSSYIQSPFALASSASSHMYIHSIGSKRKLQKHLNELFLDGCLTLLNSVQLMSQSKKKRCSLVVVSFHFSLTLKIRVYLTYVTAQTLNIVLMFGDRPIFNNRNYENRKMPINNKVVALF